MLLLHMQVYDVTSYIDDHPGGAESILLNAGVDCTDEFMGVHSQVGHVLLCGCWFVEGLEGSRPHPPLVGMCCCVVVEV
jgi:nitrate reductase (NAD(P)H)